MQTSWVVSHLQHMSSVDRVGTGRTVLHMDQTRFYLQIAPTTQTTHRHQRPQTIQTQPLRNLTQKEFAKNGYQLRPLTEIDSELRGSQLIKKSKLKPTRPAILAKKLGVERGVVEIVSQVTERPVTYAGGIKSIEDIELIRKLGNGKLDFTVGSALDIFNKKNPSLTYREMVENYA